MMEKRMTIRLSIIFLERFLDSLRNSWLQSAVGTRRNNPSYKRQRWSPRGRPWPRGHILKSLALASKVKSLASKPQVVKNCPVLGSRTALYFESPKFCRLPEKNF